MTMRVPTQEEHLRIKELFDKIYPHLSENMGDNIHVCIHIIAGTMAQLEITPSHIEDLIRTLRVAIDAYNKEFEEEEE